MLLDSDPSCRENSRPASKSEDSWANLDLTRYTTQNWYVSTKLVVEFVVAFFLLVLAVPVILVAALLTRLTSRGPAFYSQIRSGRFGRPYAIYKIRSMYHDCEKLSGPKWSGKGDPRITWLGRILRRTHVDELPQLWNVLRGDMSLIGPRPERPEFLPELERHIHRYRERLCIRPGVTGLAQVQAPADTDLQSVRNKLAYDLYYVARQNAWLDLRILLATALKVLGLPLPLLGRVFRLPSSEVVQETYLNPTPIPDLVAQVQLECP
jgi:lipopolysaccharide/colanic/teichoic acid biosynthesis glycosyltransferase